MSLLRSWIFMAFMVLSTLFIGVFLCPALLRRDWSRSVSKLWVSTQLGALRLICGVNSNTAYLTPPPVEPPVIVASKHLSMWETLHFARFFPRACFVLKKELAAIPIFGWWCQKLGFIFVDRKAGAKALRLMVAQAEKAIERGDTHIIIFPEGTRAAIGEIRPYQPGIAALARTLQIPVLPAAHNSGLFWRNPGPLKTPGTIQMRFLAPLSPSMPRAELVRTLERQIEEHTAELCGIVPPPHPNPTVNLPAKEETQP